MSQANLTIGIDLDCNLAVEPFILQTLINNWPGTVIGFMVDKEAGVQAMQRHRFNCNMLIGASDQMDKLRAIEGTGLTAFVSSDRLLIGALSCEINRLLIVH